jgi:hypothetical protein
MCNSSSIHKIPLKGQQRELSSPYYREMGPAFFHTKHWNTAAVKEGPNKKHMNLVSSEL